MSLCLVSVSNCRWGVSSPPLVPSTSCSSRRRQKSIGLKENVAGFSSEYRLSRGRVGENSLGRFRQGLGLQARYNVRSACAEEEGEEDEEDDYDWESEIFQDFSRLSGRDEDDESPSFSKEEEALVDWSSKARERAILSIQQRQLSVASLLNDGTKKKKPKSKKKKKAPVVRITKAALQKLERISKALEEKGSLSAPDSLPVLANNPLLAEMSSGEGLAVLGDYWKNLGYKSAAETHTADDVDQQMKENAVRKFPNRIVTPSLLSVSSSDDDFKGPQGYSRPSRVKRQEDFDLNRRLVEAADASEVLALVREVIGDSGWGNDGCPVSPFNISTALHRIAKHMETNSMHKSDRISFSRNRVMAQLVSAAMESLPQSSAQSISNIAWALSRVGGHLLYGTEMELLSRIAMVKISDLKPQHIANIAGALASMQYSVPPLFEALDQRASLYHRSFQPQELAQLLWAFATLNQPAERLLHSLDSECEGTLEEINTGSIDELGDGMVPHYYHDSFLAVEEIKSEEGVNKKIQAKSPGDFDAELEVVSQMNGQATGWISAEEYFKTFSFSQLASLSWSYTVLGQLERPSFSLIWHAILRQGEGMSRQVETMASLSLQLTQLYQTKLSLEFEYPNLGLSLVGPLEKLAHVEWENHKSGRKLTSVNQLDVERLLVRTGQNWVSEYTAAEYSLDAALTEEKIALEIDGPSHFARNTEEPLGHTVLKRRQLSAAGWTVLSIPYQEWDEQQGEEEQKDYLYALLKDHL